ncbi:dTDP-glucose 4,6-dehydratase [Bacillus pseudomycoides]|uniref:dTDP-glucose 4,6-dehydratase n=1 Tax=Bacillus pseudomycoides TaxID=64104 RepID=A0AA91VBH9_9BACI|nr:MULTISPECIES: dTDP-glucose 4,6-dehydratase [Bacillus]PEB52882.1 dTDP-glucose 4,6-dehydratase [Bacillus sp. AFS098217]PED81951.1 dTDP-glucose 4,6-dehydratase [Bacillus pseudomycoides]PEU07935.1 dTDP-glucose 4,6-dehydratase [Bacillus sp. AFS019443]PEU16593.1 dTDP-glucose 4,6-dehydratase [Bacillus sp. AFS014408]PFW64177.1 dTDP-glucose 4,6-dehydratase [Bacillus sp. AFS075034]
MNILVTGGAGFIGSNFIRFLVKKYPHYNIINYDALTYCGNLLNLEEIKDRKNYRFIKGDIQNKELLHYVINQYEINSIINFAAESHVDRSIENPQIFYSTNILGTTTLLEAALANQIEKFIQISTDEVYGSLGETGVFTEDTSLNPNSPYSSSKASADLIVLAYCKTYGLHVNITRCSNNYGPYQYPEKLIPLMITNALENKPLPVYGTGRNIRDWLHVYDHCTAIDLVLHKGEKGEIYNIGGNNENRNIEIVELIIEQLGASKEQIIFVKDRLGHDWRYAINAEKIKKELGWKQVYTFESGLQEVIQWYKRSETWWKPLKYGTSE